ncbi:hypothetical protein [Dehalobacter sp. TeCB1]|uniref:COG1470 family protein n=1 Tax=Dehalobacter sp. TeCB1 TaxID=1843715 RepID=UPI00083B336A|nr:hypothetical protein [Dehalobacter sp. TeCB1]OCZ49841.1 hypothetical protein A7D23_00385 [Dehalobacter sp. TeCB1]
MKKLKRALLIFGLVAVMLQVTVAPVLAAGTNDAGLTPGCILATGESGMVPFFLKNEDTAAHRYDLQALSGSNTYEMYLEAGGAAARTVKIAAGESKQVDLHLTLKGNPSVLQDTVTVKATREDGQESAIGITVQVNQDYQLSIKSLSSQVEILNGKAAELSFAVKNDGNKELQGITLETKLPYKWFSQGTSEKISLKPGETGTLKLKIEVPVSQTSGNFQAAVSAVSMETKSEPVSIPVTVKAGSKTAYWLIGLLLAAGIFTFVQFKRHGRR